MESFILFDATIDNNLLSFFAKRDGSQQIHKGSAAMIERMLQDLGIVDNSFETWSVARFISNYLVNDANSSDWQDRWAHLWEIKVSLMQPVAHIVKPNKIFPTYAYDESWEGDPFFMDTSSECIILADFYRRSDIDQAEQIFQVLDRIRTDVAFIHQLSSQYPSLTLALSELYSVYKSAPLTLPPLSVRRRTGWPYQLVIDFGTFEEAFFMDDTGGPTATSAMAFKVSSLEEALSSIVLKLYGTTTWEDRNNIFVTMHRIHSLFGTRIFSSVQAAEALNRYEPLINIYLEGWSEYSESGLVWLKNANSEFVFQDQKRQVG